MSITDLRCKVHKCRINLYTYGLYSTNMANNLMKTCIVVFRRRWERVQGPE